MSRVPQVSIGVPVYNGEKYIRAALDSLLSQTFTDFELIISDNASTDGTQAICQEFAQKDPRIRYVRQPENRGMVLNFKFVFDEARADYFMWAACDDTRSRDFVEINLKFLSENPDYVASTSPNVFEDRQSDKKNFVTFALDGDVYGRVDRFFEHCWVSHGLYYALVRTKVLKDCNLLSESFIAGDWAIILYLAIRGKIHRTSEGCMVIGIHGVSMREGNKAFRNSLFEIPFPLYRVTRYTIGLIGHFPFRQKVKIMYKVLRVNLTASYGDFRTTLSRLLRFLKIRSPRIQVTH